MGCGGSKEPEDMSVWRDDVMKTSNMERFELLPDQAGFSLLFGDSLSLAAADATESELKKFGPALLKTIREEARDMPQRLAQLLEHRGTAIEINADGNAALLFVYCPASLKHIGVTEHLATALQRSAERKKLHIDEKHLVLDVSVAVPPHVPPELKKADIKRDKTLGPNGSHGEVFLADVKDTGDQPQEAHLPKAMKVAIFTAKTPDEAGRAELLREAAAMALFYHKNLVKIVGVVTIPQNAPVMAHEYCHGGMLTDVLKKRKDFDQPTLVQFCHDVACGMQYLTSRRIVHRDLQARRVVLQKLGNKLICKVSGYGVSTALLAGASDTEYRQLYTTLHGSLPVRWSAPEVLKSGHYSQASDVWAFGVVMFEVLSRGTQPYANIKEDKNVMKKVLAGHRLACPDGFPRVGHECTILPCFDEDPACRPHFSELVGWLETIKQCGPGEEPQRGAFIRHIHRDEHVRHKTKVIRTESGTAPPGVSIWHLREVLLPLAVKAVQPPWKDSQGHAAVPPEKVTVSQAIEAHVLTLTAQSDNGNGCAYVQTLSEVADTGPADALLSYVWSYNLVSVVSALERWASQTHRDPKSTYIWISSLCLNLHQAHEETTPEVLDVEFSQRIESIGHVLPMIEPYTTSRLHLSERAICSLNVSRLGRWSDSPTLRSLWCLLEFSTAIAEGYELDIIMSESEYAHVQHQVMTKGIGSLLEALSHVQSEKATASRKSDHEALTQLIQSRPGGFGVLNHEVKMHLEGWFEKQGVGQSAARLGLAPQRSDSNNSHFERPGRFLSLELDDKANGFEEGN